MIRLVIGYVLIGLGILVATVILLYQAYGFGLGKDGQVVQNGLVFVSSQPGDAQILLDGKEYKDTTNTRLQLAEGTYKLDIKRKDYRTWQRTVNVTGGSVVRYDYPLLIPNNLTATPLKNFSSLPGLATQSPDRRWLLTQQVGSTQVFEVHDLGDPKAVTEDVTALSLPDSVISSPDSDGQSWQLTEWSTDNRHAVLQHAFAGGTEYILVDRTDAAKTVNLTKTLKLNPGQVLSLHDKKFDKYYLSDPSAKTVSSVDLDDPATVTPELTNVLAFKSYGQDILLYATETDAPAGKVLTMLKDGDVTYKIRDHAAGGPYLLDLAQYDGDWYVAVGSSVDNKVYVFRNPQAVRKTGKIQNLVPVQVLRVTAPNYLAFSSNTRFVMIENATSFAIFDAETDKNYTYATSQPLDAPQSHAVWMDGHRVSYVSGGKLVIFDYDNINMQTLSAASPNFLPFFDRDYRNLYSITPPTSATGQSILTQTNLLTPTDQ